MKLVYYSLLILGIVPTLCPAQAESEYSNWIRQTQVEQTADGSYVEVTQDNYVAKEGQDASHWGIPESGAIFQLWTMLSGGESWHLDSATIGAYLPVAQITVTAADSYAGQPRTRADKPFSVDTIIKGIINDTSLPLKATQVRYVHETDTLDGSDTSIMTDSILTSNGEISESFAVTNIRTANPLQTHGQEVFRVESFSENPDELVIEEVKLSIMPVPSGEITSLTDGTQLTAFPSEISYMLDNAYPGAEIYLEITTDLGGANEETNSRVQDTHFNVPDKNSPVDYANKTVKSTSSFGVVDATTVRTRLIHKSVFGIEILSESTNPVKGTLTVNSMLTTME